MVPVKMECWICFLIYALFLYTDFPKMVANLRRGQSVKSENFKINGQMRFSSGLLF